MACNIHVEYVDSSDVDLLKSRRISGRIPSKLGRNQNLKCRQEFISIWKRQFGCWGRLNGVYKERPCIWKGHRQRGSPEEGGGWRWSAFPCRVYMNEKLFSGLQTRDTSAQNEASADGESKEERIKAEIRT